MPWYSCVTLVLVVGFPCISPTRSRKEFDIPNNCLERKNRNFVVADNFYGIIKAEKHFPQKKNDTASSGNCSKSFTPQIHSNAGNDCIIFLQKNQTKKQFLWKNWPQVETCDDYVLLYIPKKYVKKNVTLHIMAGNYSNATWDKKFMCNGPIYTRSVCGKDAKYDASYCKSIDFNDKFTINSTSGNFSCVNCDNPIKAPDEKLNINITFDKPLESEDGRVDASGAAQLMDKMKDLISQMNGTSAELSMGKGIEGVIMITRNIEEVDEVSFAYRNTSDKMKIIEDRETLETFSRSVTVSKEAFEKAVSSNISLPFTAVLRILNISKDENNSTLLGDEVLAIEMGAQIKNLTERINIHFKQVKFDKFIPYCQSWDGNEEMTQQDLPRDSCKRCGFRFHGSRPNWTDEGCETIVDGSNIKCKCSHLTFFAVLLTPINETISSYDLKTLTIITQVGCGLSIFFLGVVLFMYFLIRKTKASTSTQILIHLVCALFLLNTTFLINHFVAELNSAMGCQVMAAVMHISMLATFSWFAVQGFHLCLQLYKGGNIVIRHYVLKVSIITWVLPSIAIITLASLGKYGKQTIYTDNPQDDVAMCWINDNSIHYAVNIGYYSVVFLFTFTTVIVTLSWLFCLKRSKAANKQESRNGSSILVILGLCCQLGITWGFAFFAYGSFRMAATYIFTILNSFQGFFLFVYYYKTTRVGPSRGNANGKGGTENTNSSISTLKTGLESIVNPYESFDKQKEK